MMVSWLKVLLSEKDWAADNMWLVTDFIAPLLKNYVMLMDLVYICTSWAPGVYYKHEGPMHVHYLTSPLCFFGGGVLDTVDVLVPYACSKPQVPMMYIQLHICLIIKTNRIWQYITQML